MLHAVLSEPGCANESAGNPEQGAYLGRTDLRFALLARLHDPGRGPQPIPRLRELCREVARAFDLPEQPDLGWPPDLANLIDALCVEARADTSVSSLDRILRLAPTGAQLEPVLIRFLLRVVGDANEGLLARASGGQIALLRQLKRLLNERLDDHSFSALDWQSVHGLIQLQLAADGRVPAPQEHFINLAARAVAEMDAASAVRWTWQAIAQQPGADGARSAAALRQRQLDVLIELMQSLHTNES
jgi:hypothetical protein